MPKRRASNDSKPGHLLIAEGQDDFFVVDALCERWNRGSSTHDKLDVKVGHNRGLDNLLRQISPNLKSPEVRSLGILFDADKDPDTQWARVRGELQKGYGELSFKTGYEYISEMEMQLSGIVIDGNQSLTPPVPRVGVWMMPDNGSSGELEDFVIDMVPEGDAVFPSAAAYIDGIPEDERKFAADKTCKAKLYAWLAARREPGRMGFAIEHGDLSTEGELARRFLDWLRRVFPPEHGPA